MKLTFALMSKPPVPFHNIDIGLCEDMFAEIKFLYEDRRALQTKLAETEGALQECRRAIKIINKHSHP